MPADSAIAARIQTALAEYLKRDAATITPSHALRDDLGLDSMATIELLFRIEEAFDLQIPDDHLHRLVTVGDVIAYVEERLAPASGAATATTPRPKKPAKPAAKQPPAKRKG
jgi:acyl carrier protein